MANEIADNKEFDGVFKFTNNSDEDFVALWNNKEYVFPAKTCSPIVISDESLENIQSIRKKWAYKWAEREWFKGKDYKKMSRMGQGLPPLRDDKVLEPLIQMCLTPLPASIARIRPAKKDERQIKATKVIDEKESLQSLNQKFAE